MFDDISMPDDIVAFARELIEMEPGEMEVIKIHMWEDDEEEPSDPHDDEVQEKKHEEFNAIHQSLVEKLTEAFGEPAISEEEDEFETIPLSGVFSAAVWDLGGPELFLAISHEDRDAPIFMAIGTG